MLVSVEGRKPAYPEKNPRQKQGREPTTIPGVGGGGVLLGILGRGVPHGSPISDQNVPFSTPVFRPGPGCSKAD